MKARANMRWLALGALLVSGLGLAQTTEQEAGDTSIIDREDRGPLKERIPPVSGHFFLRAGRFELTPSVDFSFKDAFFTKYVLGGSLSYHITESLGLNLRGGYSLVAVSGAAQKCVFNATGGPTCSPPAFNDVDGVAPGQIQALAALNLQWAPLYGKLSLIAEKVLHFDLFGEVGPAAVLYGGPRPATASSGDTPTWTVGGNVGLGMHFFINRWSALRLELQDLVYQENVGQAASPALANHSLRNQLMFDLGFSFFFPTSVEEG